MQDKRLECLFAAEEDITPTDPRPGSANPRRAGKKGGNTKGSCNSIARCRWATAVS